MVNQTHFDKQSLNCTQIYTMPVNIAIGSQDYKKIPGRGGPGKYRITRESLFQSAVLGCLDHILVS